MKSRLNYFLSLQSRFRGELLLDRSSRQLYAADASAFQQLPLAVARPLDVEDCRLLIEFCRQQRLTLTLRGSGTSLAGQCVTDGVVAELGPQFRQIGEPDRQLAQIEVGSGVVPVLLNQQLRASGLRFAPDPSTLDRCTIGGMVGNNAWGAHAIRDGAMVDNVHALEVLLSDGSMATCKPLTPVELEEKQQLPTLEGAIYRGVVELIGQYREAILAARAETRFCNSGYGLARLAQAQPWNWAGAPFNLASLLCGAEGTLALVTAATLKLKSLPQPSLLLCAHFNSLHKALNGVSLAIDAGAVAVELLDRKLLALTVAHPAQQSNRFWLRGQPEAVLLIELEGVGRFLQVERLQRQLREAELAESCSLVEESAEIDKVWALRRASLGLLMGMPDGRHAVSLIEDSAVPVAELAPFAAEVEALLAEQEVECVYYGSVSAGLLHLRPLLDLNNPAHRDLFTQLPHQLALLLRRYGGCLSAKHGDGRLRSAELETMQGGRLLALQQQIARLFDPEGLFNPQRLFAPPPLDQGLRLLPSGSTPNDNDGALNLAVNRCNGAAACVRPGDSFCPSYQASADERLSPRGRAALTRQLLQSEPPLATEDEQGLWDSLQLCLACKGCKRGCASSFDMAQIKTALLERRQQQGVVWRTRLLANFYRLLPLAAKLPGLTARLLRSSLLKKALGFAPEANLPLLASEPLSTWWQQQPQPQREQVDLLILVDPLTNHFEPQVGRAAQELLSQLGYRVGLTPSLELGRLAFSLGLRQQARRALEAVVRYLMAWPGTPLIVGLEPSEFLLLYDEAESLLQGDLLQQWRELRSRLRLFEELMVEQPFESFSAHAVPSELLLHSHCHQRALMGNGVALQMLTRLTDTEVSESGAACCGMAGLFGYQQQSAALSAQIAEQQLSPAVRAHPQATVVANGFSCRQQLRQRSEAEVLHPAELLRRCMV